MPHCTKLVIPAKALRARVVREYMAEAGYDRAVCFSCGNAIAALKDAGVDVLGIAPRGDLAPTRWWTPAEIRRVWPDYFDATSGHLPPGCMMRLAEAVRRYGLEAGCVSLGGSYLVPSGSGETLVALAMAFPAVPFVAEYNTSPATEYHEGAPLNGLVDALAAEILRY